jgi:hypothetical protein
MDELTSRAMTAWFRAGRAAGLADPDQPANDSGPVVHEGKRYVVLRNVRGVLAVYRVRNDGVLKRLKRWPPELDSS